MAVYLSNTAPIGAKIWENAFQTIPNISFFHAEKKMWRKFSVRKNSFLRFLLGFCGFGGLWTSKSASASNFALDTLNISSMRPKIIKNKTIICLAKTHLSMGKTHLCWAKTHLCMAKTFWDVPGPPPAPSPLGGVCVSHGVSLAPDKY